MRAALEKAPDSLALRVTAYSFYFYANRLREAMPHAEACLTMAANALGIPEDWRLVGPENARFAGFERPQRVYLKSLVALGYYRARLGDVEGAETMLRTAANLDPEDVVGARRLADVVARNEIDEQDKD